MLPCLIPGADYELNWQLKTEQIEHTESRIFNVGPGEVRRLADIAAGLPGDDAGLIGKELVPQEP